MLSISLKRRSHARVTKLSGVLDRMTLAYNELLQSQRAQEAARLAEGADAAGAGKASGKHALAEARDVLASLGRSNGTDGETQTAGTIFCMRQVQTDLTWVHGVLQSQKAVVPTRKQSSEEHAWADNSEYVSLPDGRQVKLSDLHGELVRDEHGFAVPSQHTHHQDGAPNATANSSTGATANSSCSLSTPNTRDARPRNLEKNRDARVRERERERQRQRQSAHSARARAREKELCGKAPRCALSCVSLCTGVWVERRSRRAARRRVAPRSRCRVWATDRTSRSWPRAAPNNPRAAASWRAPRALVWTGFSFFSLAAPPFPAGKSACA